MLLNKDLKVLLIQNLLRFESLILDTDQVFKLLEHLDKSSFDQDTSTIIKNVLNTLNFIDALDLKNSKIDLSLYKKLNELLSYNQSLAPGNFRKDHHYAYIPCIKDPISAPSIVEVNYQLDCLNYLSSNNYKSDVSRIFCNLCKSQPFYDGNKRSTL